MTCCDCCSRAILPLGSPMHVGLVEDAHVLIRLVTPPAHPEPPVFRRLLHGVLALFVEELLRSEDIGVLLLDRREQQIAP